MKILSIIIVLFIVVIIILSTIIITKKENFSKNNSDCKSLVLKMSNREEIIANPCTLITLFELTNINISEYWKKIKENCCEQTKTCKPKEIVINGNTLRVDCGVVAIIGIILYGITGKIPQDLLDYIKTCCSNIELPQTREEEKKRSPPPSDIVINDSPPHPNRDGTGVINCVNAGCPNGTVRCNLDNRCLDGFSVTNCFNNIGEIIGTLRSGGVDITQCCVEDTPCRSGKKSYICKNELGSGNMIPVSMTC